MLCKLALETKEDYCDYQLAACFKKFEKLSDDQVALLIGFFNRNDIYTKRVALDALVKHNVSGLEEMITSLWDTNDDWAGLTCLDALKHSGINDNLFSKYRDILLNSSD